MQYRLRYASESLDDFRYPKACEARRSGTRQEFRMFIIDSAVPRKSWRLPLRKRM